MNKIYNNNQSSIFVILETSCEISAVFDIKLVELSLFSFLLHANIDVRKPVVELPGKNIVLCDIGIIETESHDNVTPDTCPQELML